MSRSLLRRLRARPCPVCGPGAATEVHAEADLDPARLDGFAFASRKLPELMHYRLLRCRRCDVIYASPAPPPGGLAQAYESAEFDSAEEAAFAARSYVRHLPPLGRERLDGVLDIGTGDGAFLAALLKAGFRKVQGVEPSSAPIRSAPPALRRRIRHGMFKASRHRAGGFGLLTCFQTLEHLHDPGALLKDAFRLLKPGGAFYTVCHSHRSLSARLLGRRSPIYDIEHLQLFSPASLRRLLESRGFVDVQVRPILNVYPLHYWMKVFPLPKALKPGLIRAAKALGLGYLPIPLPAGNLAAYGVKPPARKGPHGA
jgi:SAM-dependent methyltransferase